MLKKEQMCLKPESKDIETSNAYQSERFLLNYNKIESSYYKIEQSFSSQLKIEDEKPIAIKRLMVYFFFYLKPLKNEIKKSIKLNSTIKPLNMITNYFQKK